MIEDSILQGILAFVLYMDGAAFALRAFRRSEPALVVIGLGYVVFLLPIPALLLAGQSINLWAFAVSYWFFVVSFLVIFGALYKSISLRILRDLLEKPGLSERCDVILARYIVEESYQSRLEVIQKRGLAIRKDDGYALTERGHRIARLVRAVQTVFGIRRSG